MLGAIKGLRQGGESFHLPSGPDDVRVLPCS